MYAVKQDMVERYGADLMVQLTDRDEPQTGEINDARLDRVLLDAAAEIDAYLVGRVALPLQAPPPVLKVHACTIALYRLRGSSASEAEQKDYDRALAWLSKVATGAIALTPPADAPALAGLGGVLFDHGTKAFGRESL